MKPINPRDPVRGTIWYRVKNGAAEVPGFNAAGSGYDCRKTPDFNIARQIAAALDPARAPSKARTLADMTAMRQFAWREAHK